MDKRMRVSLFEILDCISSAIDMVSPEIANHHHQTAFLAYRIAQQMQLSEEAQRNVLMAGIIHDVGALSTRERLSLVEEEPVDVNSHGFRGARLLEEFEYFREIANIVRYHHLAWDFGRGRHYGDAVVPVESHILHLADRVCVQLRREPSLLMQVPGALASVEAERNTVFMPDTLDALQALAPREYVWLELFYNAPIENATVPAMRALDMDEVLSISHMLSHIIDFRSHFTATHSAGVAATAEKLAEYAGFSQNECRQMRIAGYLHDLGKLAIDNAILEKPGKLDAREFSAIRSHTFYTYHLLGRIQGFETINQWASFHHEKLNGTGYPFHLSAEALPAGARIMAVADVFTAITEPRPYRPGMGRDQVVRTLRSMVQSGALCGRVVSSLLDHLSLLTRLCLDSQLEAAEYYDSICKEDDTLCKARRGSLA